MTTTAIATDHDAALRFITCGSVDDGKSADRPPAGGQPRRAAGPAGFRVPLRRDRPGAADRRPVGRARARHHDRRGLPLLRHAGAQVHHRRCARPRAVHPQHGDGRLRRRCRRGAGGRHQAEVAEPGTGTAAADPPHIAGCWCRVPAIVFAVNKLDAGRHLAFANIRAALEQFTEAAGIHAGPRRRFRPQGLQRGRRQAGLVRLPRPVAAGAAGADGRDPRGDDGSLRLPGAVGGEVLVLLGHLPGPPRLLGPRGHRQCVQPARRSRCSQRPDRPGWPRCWTTCASRPAWPPATAPASSSTARWTSQGDWLLAPAPSPSREVSATVAWMDDEPLVAGRVYWRCTAIAGSRPR